MRSSRGPRREVLAGLAVVAALAVVSTLISMARGGPGFLADRQTIDVIFRNGKGIRTGGPVRIAGVDVGSVKAVNLAEEDGELRACVRISLPRDLAASLRQDVKVTIEDSLTGQSCVNIVSSGRSAVALVPGQRVQGVETSLFDPILEQVGLGPVERSHLSHTIAEVRETVDAASPKLRQVLSALQETTADVRDTAATARPAVEATVAHVEEIAKKLDAARIGETVERLNALTAEAQGILEENRPAVRETITGVNMLTASLRDMAKEDGPKVSLLLDGLAQTRTRVDHVLVQVGHLTGQGNDLLTRNRAAIDRAFANIRDTSDFAVKLVGKLYGNPFYLSPFYKPTKEDVQKQEFYDAAGVVLQSAKELNDAVVALQGMRRQKPFAEMTPEEQKAYDALIQRAWNLQNQMDQTSRRLADGLRDSVRN